MRLDAARRQHAQEPDDGSDVVALLGHELVEPSGRRLREIVQELAEGLPERVDDDFLEAHLQQRRLRVLRDGSDAPQLGAAPASAPAASGRPRHVKIPLHQLFQVAVQKRPIKAVAVLSDAAQRRVRFVQPRDALGKAPLRVVGVLGAERLPDARPLAHHGLRRLHFFEDAVELVDRQGVALLGRQRVDVLWRLRWRLLLRRLQRLPQVVVGVLGRLVRQARGDGLPQGVVGFAAHGLWDQSAESG